MLKNTNKIIIVTLLNVALIVMPVQMTMAGTVEKSQQHGLKHQQAKKPCKHTKSSLHSSSKHNKSSKLNKSTHHHMVQVAGMPNMEGMSNSKEQHACKCPNLCADCCGGHASVAIFEFEFYQYTKADSSQPANKLYYYTQITLPIENPPPLA